MPTLPSEDITDRINSIRLHPRLSVSTAFDVGGFALINIMNNAADTIQGLKNVLSEVFSGSFLLVGVGNAMRGDDAAGPMLVEMLNDTPGIDCLDTGVAPENYCEQIARHGARTVILVDAMDFNGNPGEVRIFSPGEISSPGISTHGISLAPVCEYLKERFDPRIYIIGIQAVTAGFDEKPGAATLNTIDKLARVIKEFNADA